MGNAEPETATLGFTGQEAPTVAPGPIFLPREIAANRFRVVRFLGQGGMAQVFEAEDLELGQNVAIKVIRPELAASRRAHELLRREVLLARRVTHPNVCRIFDVFHHPGPIADPAGPAPRPANDREPAAANLVLVMELVAGPTLAQRLAAGGPLTPGAALPVVRQLAEALDAAHRSAVVHGDFKSGNVILEPTATGSRAVVTDFGLAQHASVAGSCTGGTTAYMAPEQRWLGQVTPASDIYALGVVIYEMVMGRRPLPHPGGAASPTRFFPRLAGDPGPVQLPQGWQETIARCLAPKPADRPASALEVARSLAAALASTPASTPAPVPRLLRPLAALRRLLPARPGAMLMPLLLLLGGIGLLVHGRIGSERSPAASSPALAALAASGARDAARSVPVRLAVAVGSLAEQPPGAGAPWMGAALGHMVLSEIGAGEQVEAFQALAPPVAAGPPPPTAAPSPAPARPDLLPNADLVVSGSFALVRQAGETADPAIRIELQLQRLPQGTVLAAFGDAGRLSDVAAVVARLGARLRRAIGIAEPSPEDRLAALARRPATLQAEGFYAQGLSLLQRGEAAAAASTLALAVAADPGFLLSHAAQAQACAELGSHDRATQEALLASRPAERLPEQQKLEIAAISRRANDDLSGAAGLYRTLWRFSPHDAGYGVQLAESQLAAGEASGALETLRLIRTRGAAAALAPRLELLEARARYALSDLPAALASALAAESQAKREGNADVLAAARLVEADTRTDDGDADNAGKALAAARDFYRRTGDRGGEAEAIQRLAVVADRTGRLPEAEALNRQALAVFDDIGSTRGSARALAAMGRGRLGRDTAQARALLERALAGFRALGDRAGAAHVLDDLSLAASDGGEPERAEKLVEEAVSLYSETGDRLGLTRALTNLSSYEAPRGELHAARQHVDEALRISEELRYKTGEAIGHIDLGDLLSMEGNLHAAGPELMKGLRLAREANFPSFERLALVDLSGVLAQEGKLGPAENALGLALALTRGKSNPDDATALWELARVQLLEGRYREAEATLRRYLKGPPGEDKNPRVLAVYAVSQAGQGRLAEAQQAIERALRSSGLDVETDLLTAIAAARVALASGQPAAAAGRLAVALQRFGATPFPPLLFEARLLLARARLDQGLAAAACPDLRSLAAQTHRQRFELVAREADRLLAGTAAGCGQAILWHG